MFSGNVEKESVALNGLKKSQTQEVKYKIYNVSIFTFHTVQIFKPLRSKSTNYKKHWLQNILMLYFAVTRKMSPRPVQDIFDVFIGKILNFSLIQSETIRDAFRA